MQWVINHIVVELIIVVVGGVLTFLITIWLRKRTNRKKLSAFLGRMFDKAVRWLKKPAVIVTPITVFVLSILYIFWFHNVLFPEKRLKVALCTFSHNMNDTHQADAWRITKDKIRKGLIELKDEINLVLIDTMVAGIDESKEVGKSKKYDLVVWGSFVHIGNVFEMEAHITLLGSFVSFESEIKEPTTERFSLSQSISQPDVIDLVRKKAQEVNNIILLLAGISKYKSGAFQNAINLFERIDPKSASLLMLIGDAYAQGSTPNWEVVADLHDQAIAMQPNNTVAYNNWGIALGNLGKNEESIEKFEKATNIDPKNEEVYNNWGVALIRLGSTEKGIEKLKKAIEINPKYALAYSNLGCALRSLGMNKEAIGNYAKAVEINPKYHLAYYNWGNILMYLGRNEEAIDKYKKAVKIDPKFASAYSNWGNVLTHLEKYQEAIKKYKKTVEIDPKDSWAYSNWGSALRNLGRDEEAIEKFKKAVEIDPKGNLTYNNWGNALSSLGRYEQAIEKYKKATEIDSNFALALKNWGDALSDLGKPEEAIERYQKAVKIDSEFTEAHFKLGALFAKSNLKEESKQELTKARELYVRKANQDMVVKVDSLLNGL